MHAQRQEHEAAAGDPRGFLCGASSHAPSGEASEEAIVAGKADSAITEKGSVREASGGADEAELSGTGSMTATLACGPSSTGDQGIAEHRNGTDGGDP